MRSRKVGVAFAALAALVLPSFVSGMQAFAAEPVEMSVKNHTRADAPFDSPNAFSALVMFKAEIGFPLYREPRLLMRCGNGFYSGWRLVLIFDRSLGAYYSQLDFGEGRSSLSLKTPTAAISPGRWHRLAATWDGDTVRMYIDGREVAARAAKETVVPSKDKHVSVGSSGEAVGIRSVPLIIERAAVAPCALSAAEVARWAADAKPFEPDTPEVADAIARSEHGGKVSTAEIEALRRTFHTPLATIELDKAMTYALIRERRFAEADRLADSVEARLKPLSKGLGMVTAFRARMHDIKMSLGVSEEMLAELRAEYAKARAENVGHLPYVALQLAKSLDMAGHADEAECIRGEIRAMDLRRFPHLAEELGVKVEYTAHRQSGARVSRSMPKKAFYVSPDGDDSGDGSRAHPFKTLSKARDAVRSLKAAGMPQGGVAVKLRGGAYKIDETLALGGEKDSGAPESPVVWCAEDGETPVLDAGFDVPQLKPVTDPAALARIPAAARAHVRCCDVRAAGFPHVVRPDSYGRYREAVTPVTDLFQDGERLMPARHPNNGWLRVEDFGTPRTTCIKTTLEDFRPWAAEPDLMATGYWKWFWADLTTYVTNVDVAAKTLCVVVDANKFSGENIKRNQTFFLLNALCAIDAPGEWFLDSRSGVLYVWPLKEGGRLTLTSFTPPILKADGLHDVRVEGLVFQDGRGTGIVFQDCHDVVFAGNVVRRFGGNGMNAHRMSGVTISDNVFRSFGHGALEVSGGDRRTLAHSGNVISNNDFSDIENRRLTYAPHLHLAGVGAEVSYNHFHDAPSSAMRLEGNDFLIVSNLVEDVLLESDDQGAVDIYFNSSYFGNRYCYNTWKNIGRQSRDNFCGQAAIRFDGNISGQSVVGNRFLNCGMVGFGAVQSCGGRLHVIDNNLFVNCNLGMSISHYPTNFWFNKIRPTLIKPCLKDVCITNAPYATRYPGIADLLWTNQVSHLVRNVTVGTSLLVEPPEPTVAYGNYSFAEMPDLDKLARETTWRPIPEECDTGPRPTPLFLRAMSNDRDGRGRIGL